MPTLTTAKLPKCYECEAMAPEHNPGCSAKRKPYTAPAIVRSAPLGGRTS